eukprot:1158437-Pelagomonas_calceolata.AAC.11
MIKAVIQKIGRRKQHDGSGGQVEVCMTMPDCLMPGCARNTMARWQVNIQATHTHTHTHKQEQCTRCIVIRQSTH